MNEITSVAPAPAGTAIVAVVVVLEVSPPIRIVGAVRSCASQVNPFVAVTLVPIVITRLQVFAPSVMVPPVEPPVVALLEHPVTVNFVLFVPSPAPDNSPFPSSRARV